MSARPGGRKISAEQAADIMGDRRPPATIARVYGITTHYVAYIRDGQHQGANRTIAAREKAAAASKPASRFYRPFRDGTYAP